MFGLFRLDLFFFGFSFILNLKQLSTERKSFASRRCPDAVVGRDPEPGVTAYQQGGVESCCIALHVPGVDPVVRANWEQFVIPFSGVRVGRRGGRIATGRPREWAIK